MKKLFILAILSIFCKISHLMSQSISRQVISTAGNSFVNGNTVLTFTVGETVTASWTTGASALTQGFQQPGESLKTGTAPSLLCAGSPLLVPFEARDIGGGNTFTAQLSNGNGSFAAPINIGTLAGNVSGAVAATIPANTPAGTGYRIRVVSSNPPLTASDNGTNIKVISPTPVPKCRNATLALSTMGSGSITPATINNGSTDECSAFGLTMSLSKSAFNCSNVGINVVTLTVTNISGNSSTCTGKVTVKDLTKPIAKCKNSIVPLLSGSTIVVNPAQVSNGSSDACTVPPLLNLSPSTFTCANSGPNVVMLTVSDVNGNNSTCTAVVTINCNNSTIKVDDPTFVPALTESFDIFPNPAASQLVVRLNNLGDAEKLLFVTDLSGKRLVSKIIAGGTDKFTFDLEAEGIPSGMYLVSIQSGGAVQSKQLAVFRGQE